LAHGFWCTFWCQNYVATTSSFKVWPHEYAWQLLMLLLCVQRTSADSSEHCLDCWCHKLRVSWFHHYLSVGETCPTGCTWMCKYCWSSPEHLCWVIISCDKCIRNRARWTGDHCLSSWCSLLLLTFCMWCPVHAMMTLWSDFMVDAITSAQLSCVWAKSAIKISKLVYGLQCSLPLPHCDGWCCETVAWPWSFHANC